MHLTKTESAIVKELRRSRVATMKSLREQFQVSHMTVVRALRKEGYFSSYNFNSAYYTLRETPQFDEHGLWAYRKVRFSQFGSLPETIVQLVNDAPAGMTVNELQQRLDTQVANLLGRLCGEDRIARIRQGRCAVYLAIDGPCQERQIEQRATLVRAARSREATQQEEVFQLPPRYDAALVVSVLVEVIRKPRAKPAQLAENVRRQGVRVTKPQVQRILDFYAIKKKRRSGRG